MEHDRVYTEQEKAELENEMDHYIRTRDKHWQVYKAIACVLARRVLDRDQAVEQNKPSRQIQDLDNIIMYLKGTIDQL